MRTQNLKQIFLINSFFQFEDPKRDMYGSYGNPTVGEQIMREHDRIRVHFDANRYQPNPHLPRRQPQVTCMVVGMINFFFFLIMVYFVFYFNNSDKKQKIKKKLKKKFY